DARVQNAKGHVKINNPSHAPVLGHSFGHCSSRGKSLIRPRLMGYTNFKESYERFPKRRQGFPVSQRNFDHRPVAYLGDFLPDNVFTAVSIFLIFPTHTELKPIQPSDCGFSVYWAKV